MNPVLRREMVERWRGRRAGLTLTVYLVVLSLLTWLAYWGAVLIADDPFGGLIGPEVGRATFENVVTAVLLLVLFVGPGYAAAQIAGERERRTLGLLQITLLRPIDIALGKFGAAVAWQLLLVVASAPVAAVAVMIGGVSLWDVLRSFLLIAVVVASVSAMALAVSASVRRTTAAVVVTYGLVLVILVGTGIGALIEVGLRRGEVRLPRPPAVLYAHPLLGLADAAGAETRFNQLPSILVPFAYALQPTDVFADGVEFVDREAVPVPAPLVVEPVAGSPPPAVPGILPGVPTRRPAWLITSAIYLAAGLVALLITARRLGVGPARSRLGRRPRPPGPAPGEPADPARGTLAGTVAAEGDVPLAGTVASGGDLPLDGSVAAEGTEAIDRRPGAGP